MFGLRLWLGRPGRGGVEEVLRGLHGLLQLQPFRLRPFVDAKAHGGVQGVVAAVARNKGLASTAQDQSAVGNRGAVHTPFVLHDLPYVAALAVAAAIIAVIRSEAGIADNTGFAIIRLVGDASVSMVVSLLFALIFKYLPDARLEIGRAHV